MKSSSVIALLVLAALTALSLAQQPFVLTDGTPIRVRLNRNISSAHAKVGETVDFDVVEDVLVNGVVVIQRNSRVLATVTEARPKGLMGKAGKLNVNTDHARSILGEKIALRAVKEYKNGDPGNEGRHYPERYRSDGICARGCPDGRDAPPCAGFECPLEGGSRHSRNRRRNCASASPGKPPLRGA